MNDIIFIVGLFISSFVTVSIVFDFMDNIFLRTYKNKWLYFLTKCGFVIILAIINSFNNSWLNFLTVVILADIIGLKFYSGNYKKIILNNICLIICIGACESVGIAILHFIYKIFQVSVSENLFSFFDITLNQLIVIFIYHLLLLQVLRKKEIRDLTYKQYFLSFLYGLFSLINIYSLNILLKKSPSGYEIMLVVITAAGIVIINTCFLNILEFISEINQLQYENRLYIQQSKMQYQYYNQLEQQHRESLGVLHDVKRHLWAIEELYRNKENETASEYTKNINDIIYSFQLNEFTDNRMLNIILNDKKRRAVQNNISFICNIDNVELNFIDNIDLTTIFSNLLDNAIEACMELEGNKTIIVQIAAFNNLVIINIKNTMNETMEYIGADMKSSKKNHVGFGISNVKKVISKYNGDFNIQKEGNMFVCNIVLSKQGRII